MGQTLSLLEEKRKSIGQSAEQTMFHAVPSHIQQFQQQHAMQIAAKKCEVENASSSNKSPWELANEARAETAKKEKEQTNQFIKAQERGKIALEKEVQKQNAKQLDSELE